MFQKHSMDITFCSSPTVMVSVAGIRWIQPIDVAELEIFWIIAEEWEKRQRIMKDLDMNYLN